jgi:hypothetical protein
VGGPTRGTAGLQISPGCPTGEILTAGL